MKKLIILADWAEDTLSFQEVRSAVEGYVRSDSIPAISAVHSTPHTIHAAFLLNQIVQTEVRYGRPLETVVLADVDIRTDADSHGLISPGAELLILRLASGLHILGSNTDHMFSLIRKDIDVVFRYPDLSLTGQFRARDVYAKLAAYFIDDIEDDLLLDEAPKAVIPALDGVYIGHIDNFGTLKTTMKQSDLREKYEYEERVPVQIGATKLHAVFTRHMFAGRCDELTLFPGSSGDIEDPFIEIAIRRDLQNHAKRSEVHFPHASPGMAIRIG